jgi:hypothetical protein
MAAPDCTTHPAASDSRGPTEEITGPGLQRNIEKTPPVTVNGPQVVVWFAVLVAVKVPDPPVTNSP